MRASYRNSGLIFPFPRGRRLLQGLDEEALALAVVGPPTPAPPREGEGRGERGEDLI